MKGKGVIGLEEVLGDLLDVVKQILHVSKMCLAFLLLLKPGGQSIGQFLLHSTRKFELNIDQVIF